MEIFKNDFNSTGNYSKNLHSIPEKVLSLTSEAEENAFVKTLQRFDTKTLQDQEHISLIKQQINDTKNDGLCSSRGFVSCRDYNLTLKGLQVDNDIGNFALQ